MPGPLGFIFRKGVTMAKIIPEETGLGDELFLEEFTGRYFKSSKKAVLEAEKRLNDVYLVKGYARLNDFYALLHLRRTDLGEYMGWIMDTDHEKGEWIKFDHMLTDLGITNISMGRGYTIRYPIPPGRTLEFI